MAHVRTNALRGFVVLLLCDLPVAQKELAKALFGGVGGGEDDLAFEPVQRAVEPRLFEVQLAAPADHRDKAQHIGDLNAPQISFENRPV